MQLETWMKELGDDTRIGTLLIPGTHNSAACHTALPSVRCQGQSVTDQLEHGVRFLDIRLGKHPLKAGSDALELTVVHGKFPVRIPFPRKFASIMDEVYGFLQKHPSETVLVSLKQEGTGDWDNGKAEFAQVLWDRYIAPHKNKWVLGAQLPKLGDARGKVILFRRFGTANNGPGPEFGFDASSWKYNTIEDDRGTFCVQDFCEIKSKDDIPKKVEYVKRLAVKAHEHNLTSLDGKLFLNFTLGSNFFDHDCWPEQVATAMAQHKLQDSFGSGTGVVVLDYIERDNWGMARALVEKNLQRK